MKKVFLRFYAELNDFLPPERRMVSFPWLFHVASRVRDVIESVGVPHTEVDLILVNGHSVDFSHVIEDGDRISVYPVFESMDITPVLRLRPHPLRQPRFVLDVHLGRLAGYLRMMGFDALYRNSYTDRELAGLSGSEDRILLTRDVGLLKRTAVTHGYFVRETSPRRQLREVLRRFDLTGLAAPFTRCIVCNGLLQPAEKETVKDALPPKILETQTGFLRCESCGRVYWKGSHYDRMQKLIASLSAT
jgi:uncharacterized protein with PIN domain